MCSNRAFTLLEILVVVGIIGLIASVLVVGSMQFVSQRNPSPDDVFWKAVNASRHRALVSGEEVRLRYVGTEKERAFVSSAKSGEEKFPLGLGGELKIDLLSTEKNGSQIMIMSQIVETHTVKSVVFYNDGTCSPFKLQIRMGGGAGAPRIVAIDPWTCSLVLPKEKEN